MPGGDRTGPMGMGPMSGRAAGFCAGFGIPGYANPAYGSGLGRGRGFGMHGSGRGRRNMFYATGVPGWMRYGGYPAFSPNSDPETEKQVLKNQADMLQSELESIRKRLDEIETGSTEK